MKKIVGILGMAAVLASGAFAADPAANFVMTEFKGNADFGFKADFTDSKNVKSGMYNDIDSSLKFGFVTAGSKATTGDGVWGEIAISSKASDAAAMPAKPSVDTAKIHFVDGNFKAALNILKPGLKYGEYASPAATGTSAKTEKIGMDVEAAAGTEAAGFAIETELTDLFALNFKLMDNGIVKSDDKKFGMAIDASLKAVEGLTFDVASTFNFDKKYTGVGVNTAYKLNMDNGLYVQPGAAFTMSKLDKADAVNTLEAGVLFGWGASGIKPEFNTTSS